ncbi:D-2-hydroxyacid dehydrogenase [Paenibacillus polymyxa]|uniref:D-2-hydroxyacid dehydrogenase n=1 Tax=Paenibacillus polymyxa TaxID=1406 RepID=UPI00202401C0|nr:D-2-hydroxyacid dehydrogenase [Paenibacillus polymyxa]URJ48464.3 D-2-hydroxyacid dehydrogenase [Paenibacillus polymyxa]
MGNILSLHQLTEEQKKQVRATAPGYELIIGKAQELESKQIREAEVILGWSKHIAEEALHQDSKLKWIQTWSAGIDKLPLTELEKRNILLTNTSGVHAIPITEQIFGMLLSHTRYLQQAALLQRQKTWQPPKGQLTELRGKTLLITGVGEIGRETARIAEAFGMRVIGIRRSGKEAPHVEHMYTNEQLHEALGAADIVVNILPFTEETHHFFDEKAFAAMRKGAFFINVGRGGTVHTDALVRSLEQKHIAFAGLDVFEEEPLPASHPLWSLDHVLITPHIAGDTDRYAERAVDIFLTNLNAYAADQELPLNVVNYKTQY